jgi:hypothetical protein
MDRPWNPFLCPPRSPDFKQLDMSFWDLMMRAVFVSPMPPAFPSYKCMGHNRKIAMEMGRTVVEISDGLPKEYILKACYVLPNACLIRVKYSYILWLLNRFIISLHFSGALLYKPEGRGFDSRWCHWNFSLTSFRPHYGPEVDSVSNRNEYQEYFVEVKAAGA